MKSALNTLLLSVLGALLIGGCSALFKAGGVYDKDVAPKVVQGLVLYCQESEILRGTLRADINARLAPYGITVKVECPATPIGTSVPAPAEQVKEK